MKKLFAALAAVMLALILYTPPASASCWRGGHRWHCGHHYRHHAAAYRPAYYPPFYYRPGYYPYAYYPAPANYVPYYSACFLLWPFSCL